MYIFTFDKMIIVSVQCKGNDLKNNSFLFTRNFETAFNLIWSQFIKVDGPCPSKMQISISMDVLSNLHSILSTTIACVASVSVRLSARSMHFSLFWPWENWGECNQKAKNASNGQKALRKRLLCRLQYYHKE